MVTVRLNTTTPGQQVPVFGDLNDLPTPDNSYGVAVGDFDGDGKPDLAVANLSGMVSVFLNTTAANATTPSFGPRVDLPAGPTPISVAVGDLDGDGKPDLVVADWQGAAVTVLTNATPTGAASASFTQSLVLATSANPYSCLIDDLDGDGHPDITVATTSNSSLYVFRNTTP